MGVSTPCDFNMGRVDTERDNIAELDMLIPVGRIGPPDLACCQAT